MYENDVLLSRCVTVEMSVVKERGTGLAPNVGFAGTEMILSPSDLYFSAIRQKRERPLGSPPLPHCKSCKDN